MLFYFSGILPLNRKPGPDDPDILFFRNKGSSYDRLVCLIYGKEADMIISNVQQVEEKHGKSEQKRTRRRT